MMCFMQWMMGNQAHLMTIIMVLGIIYNHISQILKSGSSECTAPTQLASTRARFARSFIDIIINHSKLCAAPFGVLRF